jgi:hypothetical protein
VEDPKEIHPDPESDVTGVGSPGVIRETSFTPVEIH